MGEGISGDEGRDYGYPAVYSDDSRMPIVGNVNEFDQLIVQATVYLKEKVGEGLAKVRNLLPRKEK